MSLIFVDSFDHYVNQGVFTYKKWNTIGLTTTALDTIQTKSKTGPRSVHIGSTTSFVDYHVHTFANDEVFIQFWLYKGVEFGYIEDAAILKFYSNIGLDQSQLYLYNLQYFQIVNNGSVVAENKDFLLSYGTWHFIQVKWTVTDSTSSDDVIVKVDGVEVLNPVGIDTKQQSSSILGRVGISGTNQFSYLYVDDVVIMDNQSGYNDGFTSGATFVEARKPNGAGNYSQWTSSGGTNYLMVDDFDAHPDGDTTYVESGTIGNRDSYDFENLSAASPTILGVAANIFAIETTGTSRDIKQFSRISSTDYDQIGVFSPVGSSYYEFDQYIWDESPATSTAWTSAEFDGAEFGVELDA